MGLDEEVWVLFVWDGCFEGVFEVRFLFEGYFNVWVFGYVFFCYVLEDFKFVWLYIVLE